MTDFGHWSVKMLKKPKAVKRSIVWTKLFSMILLASNSELSLSFWRSSYHLFFIVIRSIFSHGSIFKISWKFHEFFSKTRNQNNIWFDSWYWAVSKAYAVRTLSVWTVWYWVSSVRDFLIDGRCISTFFFETF